MSFVAELSELLSEIKDDKALEDEIQKAERRLKNLRAVKQMYKDTAKPRVKKGKSNGNGPTETNDSENGDTQPAG